MTLAIAGWNFEWVVPLAVAALAFAVFSWRNAPVASVAIQFRRSLLFWLLGLALLGVLALLTVASGGAGGTQWSGAQVHKALGLASGALLASYVPFAAVAVVSHGSRWRSATLYIAVLLCVLIPLFALMPPLVAASAVVSCVLLQVPQCL